jgi:hypothetical protein
MDTSVRILLLALIFSSCSVNKLEKFSYTNSKNAWIDSYKDQVFFSCFMQGHQNDTVLRKLLGKRDLQNSYEAIYIEDIIKASELGKKIADGIPIATIGCEDCKNGEKFIIPNCLHYYKSKDLDSIARREFKIFNRKHNKFWKKVHN